VWRAATGLNPDASFLTPAKAEAALEELLALAVREPTDPRRKRPEDHTFGAACDASLAYVAPAAEQQRRRLDRGGVERLAETEAVEVAGRVGRQRHAGADLAVLGCLLVDPARHVARRTSHVAHRERDGERQPADAAAHDGDAAIGGHRRGFGATVYATAGVRAGASAKSYSNWNTPGSSSLAVGWTMSSGLTALATSLSR
jgi:hypothetical protein